MQTGFQFLKSIVNIREHGSFDHGITFLQSFEDFSGTNGRSEQQVFPVKAQCMLQEVGRHRKGSTRNGHGSGSRKIILQHGSELRKLRIWLVRQICPAMSLVAGETLASFV